MEYSNKTAQGKERLQALYLLKPGKMKAIQNLNFSLRSYRTNWQRWLRRYRHRSNQVPSATLLFASLGGK